MSDISTTFAVLGAVVVLFVWNRLPVEMVAIGAALVLVATGVLDIDQALSGFGDPTVIFIAALFIVSEGLDATGVTTWAGQHLIARAGESRTRLTVLMMLLVASLTALISVNGAVAALFPMVVVIAIRLGRSPSQLLMPLAFAAHAGSMLTLTGTPVNILVSEASVEAGEGAFGYFEFALIGIPLVLGCIAIAVVLGPRLLPNRTPRSIPPNLSDHARTLIDQYARNVVVAELSVTDRSAFVGVDRNDIDLSAYPLITLLNVKTPTGDRRDATPLAPEDLLVVGGKSEAIAEFAASAGLTPVSHRTGRELEAVLMSREVGVVEVVIPPRSSMVGVPVFPGMVTSSGDYVILAVQRGGQDLGPRETEVEIGDTLLLQGTWDVMDANIEADPDVLVVDPPHLVRRQVVPMGLRAKEAVAILIGMVVLLATGVVPAVVAALLGAGAMILTRVLSMEQAYRSISWTTVLLVGGMIPLSDAVRDTGAADEMAHLLVDVVGEAGPYALLAGLFVLTAVLGQLISNMATALVVIPIAVTAAGEMGVAARPVLMSLTIAAAAAFLTPVATPANLMVMGPGGYRFGDYWKLGIPMLAWFFVVAVFVVPVFWSL